MEDAISIVSTGFTAATGAASASQAIPNAANGAVPKYIRVAAINETYVKVGQSAVAATANDILIQPADAVILKVAGHTHIAYIQGAAVGKVNVVPLEDL